MSILIFFFEGWVSSLRTDKEICQIDTDYESFSNEQEYVPDDGSALLSDRFFQNSS
jgi:hypothetical protein